MSDAPGGEAFLLVRPGVRGGAPCPRNRSRFLGAVPVIGRVSRRGEAGVALVRRIRWESGLPEAVAGSRRAVRGDRRNPAGEGFFGLRPRCAPGIGPGSDFRPVGDAGDRRGSATPGVPGSRPRLGAGSGLSHSVPGGRVPVTGRVPRRRGLFALLRAAFRRSDRNPTSGPPAPPPTDAPERTGLLARVRESVWGRVFPRSLRVPGGGSRDRRSSAAEGLFRPPAGCAPEIGPGTGLRRVGDFGDRRGPAAEGVLRARPGFAAGSGFAEPVSGS